MSPNSRDDLSKERFYELIVERAPACIALLRGPEFVFELVNPAYAAVASGIEMPGKTVVEVFPEIGGIVIPVLRRVLETGESYRVDDTPLSISRHDGSASEIRYFSFSYTRIADGKTADTHSILVLALENTARKKAEEAAELAIADLKKQWRAFDTALSNAPDFIYTFDMEGRIAYANSALLSLWQIPLEAAVGKNFFDLGYPADLADRLQRQIEHVIAEKEAIRDQTPFAGPTGETRHYEYIFVPVLGLGGKVEAVVGTTRDVTEQKKAEEQERERQVQLRDSARLESLGLMAGGVAHDFNNLLVGILGNASLLVETVNESDGPIASEIVLAAERAAALTTQMLAYSGKGRLAMEIFDVNALIQENLRVVRASLPGRVGLELYLCDACPIEADRTQVNQVIMNLLINAAEAIGDAGGKIRMRTEAVERKASAFSTQLHTAVPAGFYALIEIQDNGAGMGPETLKKIFDPFFTTKFTGRGLGLAAVLGIVKGHRGDIEVESSVGAGTTFRVFLPASERAVAVKRERKPAAGISETPRTVLVVDDELTVRKVAKSALERSGFRVVLAANGAEGLEVLRENSDISMVVLDLTMPVMTGEQALPLIKAMRPEIPVVLSSGFNEEEICRRFAADEIAEFLQKPYTASAITSKVLQALGKESLSSQ